jgi:hypothetical protein
MTEVEFIGNIDEAGFLKNFSRQGFSIPKCLAEAVANSLDAMRPDQQKRIHFQQDKDNILMIDNAKGMINSEVRNMYAAHFENHSSHKSKGVSGIGGKIAQYHLSRKTHSTLLTHQKGGPYLKVYAPWEEMMKNGKYSSMFKCIEMSKDEIDQFNLERFDMIEKGEEPVGTTIIFPYNDPLYECVLENFESNEERKSHLDAMDRISVIFGREDNLRITAELADFMDGYKEMEFYNYFGGKASDYYDGIDIQIVHLYMNRAGDARFIWKKTEEEEFEIPKVAKGFSRDLKKRTKSLDGFSFEGEYEVVTGLRRQEGINPRDITGEKVIGSYDRCHIGDNDNFLAHYKVVRNDQGIGLIEPEVKIGNARANKLSNLEIFQVQTEIRFNPLSSQDSVQDQITGVQQNKNQFNGKNVQKNLTRLIYKIRGEKCKMIEKFLGISNKQNATPSESDNQSEKDIVNDFEETVSVKLVEEMNISSKDQINENESHHLEETVSVNVNDTIILSEEQAKIDETSHSEEETDFKSSIPASDLHSATETSPVVEQEVEQAAEQYEEEQQRPRIPIDVKGYRRRWVSGRELREELMRAHIQISDDQSFIDVEIIEFYNKLKGIKFGV